jgi:hypothetical protein
MAMLLLLPLATAVAPILVLCSILLVFVAAYVFDYCQTRGRIQRWAEANSFRIHCLGYRWIFKRPFSYARLQGGTVYRIDMDDDQGQQRIGFIRCHGWLSLMPGARMQVIWDKQ